MTKMIKCPSCNSCHYWQRRESLEYKDNGKVTLMCKCGCSYRVLRRKDRSVIVRRNEE